MAGEDDRLGEGTDEQQGHLYSKSGFFRRPLPREAVESLVENLAGGRIAGQSRELDFTPWGGAYNRVPAGATAFAHRDELFLIQHAVVTGPDASAAGTEEARRWLGRSWDLVRPWGSGGVYPNWPDPDLEDWAIAYTWCHFAAWTRKEKVRSRRLLPLPPVGPASSTRGSARPRWIASANRPTADTIRNAAATSSCNALATATLR